MKSFVVLSTLFICALAADPLGVSSVSYGASSGTVSSSSVDNDAVQTTAGQGVYGPAVLGTYAQKVHEAKILQPKIDVVQPVVPQVKFFQPEVKPIDNADPFEYVHDVRPARYAHAVFKQVQPVEYVHPVSKQFQPVVKSVGYVHPIVKQVQPIVKPVEYVRPYQPLIKRFGYVQPSYVQGKFVKSVEHVQPAVKYFQPVQKSFEYVQPAVKYVQPVLKSYDFVQPSAKHVEQVHPAMKPSAYAQPTFVQPTVKHAPLADKFIDHQEVISKHVPVILRMNQEASFDGNFNYGYESEDGIVSEASGALKGVEGSQDPAQVMQGTYSYVAPDGTPVSTSWYADETGFHAEGAHLPVPPPVPEAISRSLEYLRSLPRKKTCHP